MIPLDADAADAEAVARCAAGNADALEVLYHRYAGVCLAHARSILVDFHHAEDVVQEVYLDLWRHAGRFDSRRSRVRQWLLMLTHRKAVDRVRSEQRRKTLVLSSGQDRADERPEPPAQALIALLGVQARQALAALPPVKREVLVLAYWGGYTQREIAEVTNTPIGTVKSRMHTAMKDLAVTLADDDVHRVDAALSVGE